MAVAMGGQRRGWGCHSGVKSAGLHSLFSVREKEDVECPRSLGSFRKDLGVNGLSVSISQSSPEKQKQ